MFVIEYLYTWMFECVFVLTYVCVPACGIYAYIFGILGERIQVTLVCTQNTCFLFDFNCIKRQFPFTK